MSRYDGLIIPRSYSEYINKTDAATLKQALQLAGVLSKLVTAGDNRAVTSSAVNTALSEYINKTDATTLQQALQLSGVLSDTVTAGDNKAVKSGAVATALAGYFYKSVYTTSNGAFNNSWANPGAYEIFIFDTEDVNKWIKLIYTTDNTKYTLFKVNNVILDVRDVNKVGTIVISGGSGNLKAISTVYN